MPRWSAEKKVFTVLQSIDSLVSLRVEKMVHQLLNCGRDESELDFSIMKMITGSILVLAGEQAFAHSLSIPFPNQIFASQVLYPSSMALVVLGVVFLIWGAVTERGQSKS